MNAFGSFAVLIILIIDKTIFLSQPTDLLVEEHLLKTNILGQSIHVVQWCKDISKHILTAGHSVMNTVNPENCGNDTSSVVSVIIPSQQLSIYVGMGAAKIDGSGCCDGNIRGTGYKAIKIFAHDYGHCELKNDIVLIKVSADIPDHISVPICMPSESLPDVVAQQLISVDESMHKTFATAYAKSPCPGNSGGPVFQIEETDRNILVGLTSHGDPCLKVTGKCIFLSDIKSYIVDVRAYLDWICKHSGVCALEELNEFSFVEAKNVVES